MAMLSRPAPDRPELTEMLRQAAARFDSLSAADKMCHREAQRRSWVVGETMLAHPEMTRQRAEELYDEAVLGAVAVAAGAVSPSPDSVPADGGMSVAAADAGARRIFLDTEFYEDGLTIQLISIGMVRSDGATYYAETVDSSRLCRASAWLSENVRPHLRGGLMTTVKPRHLIRNEILEFVGPGQPEFWAYYADYDWVALCQLFGRMIDLPPHWPKHCRDVLQAAEDFGVVLPERFGDDIVEHNALADAEWCRRAHAYVSARR